MVAAGEIRDFSWLAAMYVSMLGFASWIVVNGVWVELPVLVNYLPEGWSLPAYLSIIIQIANFGPVLYMPLTRLCRGIIRTGFWWRCLKPPERLANYIILAIGLLSSVLMAHLWNLTVSIASNSHSAGLLVLAFFASIVDCTSSITFVAYLSGLPETYVGALQFGEGFSDLVPSTIALIQGVGEAPVCVNYTVNGSTQIKPVYPPPRFSVTAFMYCLAALLALAFTAFCLLDLSPSGLGRVVSHHYTRAAHLMHTKVPPSPHESEVDPGTTSPHNLPVVAFAAGLSDSVLPVSVEEFSAPIVYTSPSKHLGIGLLTSEYLLPIGLLVYISFLSYGFLPAFQTYSSASYDSLTYHLAVALSGVVSAILIVVSTYFVHRNKLKQSLLTSALLHSSPSTPELSLRSRATNGASPSYVRRSQLIWVLLAGLSSIPTAYVIYLACKSPHPPQLGGFGPALSVMSWISLRSGFVILRTWLWLHLSSRSHEADDLRYAGLATQIGAAFGAILSFLLVVHFKMFHAKYPCT